MVRINLIEVQSGHLGYILRQGSIGYKLSSARVPRVHTMSSQGTQGTFCGEGQWDTSFVVMIPREQAMFSQGTQSTFGGEGSSDTSEVVPRVNQCTQGTFLGEVVCDTSYVARVPRVQSMFSQGTLGTF